jgi:hypothetical protein
MAASDSRCSMRMEPALGLDPKESRCFLPIHIYEATTGLPVAISYAPARRPTASRSRACYVISSATFVPAGHASRF